MIKLFKTNFFPLLVILLLAFTLRLYKINLPLADWHSFRQADTASVTREYLKHGIDLLRPTYHDLSSLQSGQANPHGYRMVEFPLINGLTTVIIRTFSLSSSQVLVGRLVSIFFSLITLTSIYYLGLKLSGRITALVAAFAFAVLPYSIYYSRAILPEPALIALTSLALVCFLNWLNSQRFLWYLLSFISFSLALLIKPFALFLYPLFFCLGLFVLGKKTLQLWPLLLFVLLTPLPLIFWRSWITQFPAGIPVSSWLYNQNNIRLKGAFFHWLFEVRLSTLILGIGGLVPLVLGFIKKGKDKTIYLTWSACLLAYLVIIAGGNVQHDYYQVLLLPLLCLLLGRGVKLILKLPSSLVSRFTTISSLILLSLFSLFVSWYHIRNYYTINHWEIIKAGQAIDRLTPSDAKIIAPYNGDTAFLFQTNRTGWPLGRHIDEKIKAGASYYVSVNYDDEARELEKKYQVIEKNNDFIIVNLQQKQ